MLDFISKNVRQYMEQNNMLFTDFEKAAIIYHSNLGLNSIHIRLKAIADNTDDSALKEQILERLKLDSQYIELSKNKTEGFIFAVEFYYDCTFGYFNDWETAYKFSVGTNQQFYIKKYPLINSNAMAEEKETNESFSEDIYTEIPTAEFAYDKYGNLKKFWSSESETERICRNNFTARFENGFVNIPNPFIMGDIVKLTTHESHGIVAAYQKERKEFLKKVANERPEFLDFSDASIMVDFIDGDGHIRSRDINPIYLEKHEPQKGDKDYNILMAGSALYSGKASLSMFSRYYDDYKKVICVNV